MRSLMQVEMGAGIVEVLQLDDASVCQALGIEWDYISPKRVAVSGNLRNLRDDLDYRASGAFDQPLWYASSARAACRRIDRAIADA